MPRAGCNKVKSVLSLGLQARAIWHVVVDKQNVENVHVQALEHRKEFRTRLCDVSVSVNRFERGKFSEPELVLVFACEHPAEHVTEPGPANEGRLASFLGRADSDQQNAKKDRQQDSARRGPVSIWRSLPVLFGYGRSRLETLSHKVGLA